MNTLTYRKQPICALLVALAYFARLPQMKADPASSAAGRVIPVHDSEGCSALQNLTTALGTAVFSAGR